MKNKEKRVLVILSAYNWDKYIKAQIDSILSQDYKNITILVRDDWSIDNTFNILQSYWKKILLMKDRKNLWFRLSFKKLLEEYGDYDYYAFADQDDVRKKEKISRAVKWLDKENDEKIPMMYASDVTFCDESLNEIKHIIYFNTYYDLIWSMYYCPSPWMTFLFNNKARELFLMSFNPEKYVMFHDGRMAQICAWLWKVILDDYKSVYYRRYETAVTNVEHSRFKYYRKLRKILKDQKNQNIYYRNLYYNNLSDENKKIMDIFTHPRRWLNPLRIITWKNLRLKWKIIFLFVFVLFK